MLYNMSSARGWRSRPTSSPLAILPQTQYLLHTLSAGSFAQCQQDDVDEFSPGHATLNIWLRPTIQTWTWR
jgi:hypothetical protein